MVDSLVKVEIEVGVEDLEEEASVEFTIITSSIEQMIIALLNNNQINRHKVPSTVTEIIKDKVISTTEPRSCKLKRVSRSTTNATELNVARLC